MALARLLGETSVPGFLEDHWLKQPLARAGGCLRLSSLGSWEALERLLARPEADSRASRHGALWEGGRVASGDAARALLAEGWTIGVRHAERHDEGLATLAASFREEFRAPIDVHLYCTPARQPGLGWHYDAEEVFVLQTLGGKEWKLRKNTV
ncbi:MAG: cupin domain-containing protein, partial [Gemmataceae bacterium]|nr:cupin domain-containing protein [Gemmataceae bacterium]